MKIAMFLLLSLLGCVLAVAWGYQRPQVSKLWGYTIMNHSGETFTDEVISYPGATWPQGNDPSGIGGASIGVISKMPDAVDLSITSRDGIRHKIHVLIPPQPAEYKGETPDWYLLILSRYKAIATWINPDSMDIKVFWSCVPGAERFSNIAVFYGQSPERKSLAQKLGSSDSGVATIDPGKSGLDDLDVGFQSADGVSHKVHVTLPKPITSDSKVPDIHLLIESRDKVIAKYTYPARKVIQRWFCTIPPNGAETVSRVTIVANGRSYKLGPCGPHDDTSLSALGPMPKAIDVSFTRRDGTRHKAHVSLPAQPGTQPPYAEPFDPFYSHLEAAAKRDPQPPHVDLAFKSDGEVVATVATPYQVKPRPSWFCSIMNDSAESFSHMTFACDDGKPERVSDDLRPGTGFGMNPYGRRPKMLTIGFMTKDGTRHSVRVTLPALPHLDAENAGVRLGIESRDKITVTETGPQWTGQ